MTKSDYLYTLARTADTEPKHQGISLFLVPANAPGITYQAQEPWASAPRSIFFM